MGLMGQYMEKVQVHELDLHQNAWGVFRLQGRAQHKLCFLLCGLDPTSLPFVIGKPRKSSGESARSNPSADASN